MLCYNENMSEYVSWKAGDPKIKPAPQKIKPKTWTLLKFDEGDAITPKTAGTAIWGFYVNVDDAAGLTEAEPGVCASPALLVLIGLKSR